MHSISLHNDVNWVQNDDTTVVLANCQLLVWARVARVASPFPRGRVRVARLRLVHLGTPTPHLPPSHRYGVARSPLPLPRGEVE
jgi:hypothetical protein